MKSLLIILFYLTGIQSVKKCHEKANNYYLKNGQLVDVEKNSIYSSDILIKNGKIEAIGSNIYLNNSDYNIDYKVIDLKNKLVTPGLIDMHVHAYYGGTYWGIKPERSAIESGVTTILDTGSAGCFTFTNFKETVISNSPLSIYSFINIVGQGLVLRTGELMNTELSLDFNSTLDIIEENLEFIKGIKVRLDKFTTKDGDLTGLFMARKIATKFNIPLMIHIGHSPPTIEDIEPYLIQGDIITHFYNGHGNKLILEDYKTPKDVLIKLFNKGVLFDVGHGGGGFNFKVALPLIQSNYLPNTISSDLHQVSRISTAKNLLNVVNKMVALGIPLIEVIKMTTVNPAKILKLNNNLGYLKKGYKADIAIFEIEYGNFSFQDTANNNLTNTKRLKHHLTFKNGIKLSLPKEPNPFPWALRDVGVVSGNKP